jgi:hypothetical protein
LESKRADLKPQPCHVVAMCLPFWSFCFSGSGVSVCMGMWKLHLSLSVSLSLLLFISPSPYLYLYIYLLYVSYIYICWVHIKSSIIPFSEYATKVILLRVIPPWHIILT